jgi:hypothetical protein
MESQYPLFGAIHSLSGNVVRNDVRTGDAAEAFVIAKLLKWGYDAHDARRDLPYDVVVDVGNGRICRVQVKGRGRASNGAWSFRAQRGNWRSATGTYAYTEADFDVSAFVALSIEKVLFITGILPTFKATTADFLRAGAEQESWGRALQAYQTKGRAA